MPQISEDELMRCNGMGRFKNGMNWFPLIKRDDGFLTADGRRIAAPKEFREMAGPEIIAEINARRQRIVRWE